MDDRALSVSDLLQRMLDFSSDSIIHDEDLYLRCLNNGLLDLFNDVMSGNRWIQTTVPLFYDDQEKCYFIPDDYCGIQSVIFLDKKKKTKLHNIMDCDNNTNKIYYTRDRNKIFFESAVDRLPDPKNPAIVKSVIYLQYNPLVKKLVLKVNNPKTETDTLFGVLPINYHHLVALEGLYYLYLTDNIIYEKVGIISQHLIRTREKILQVKNITI